MSSNLSDADIQTLHETGEDIVRTFVAVVVEVFLYVIYGVLVIIASRALLKSRRPPAHSLALLGIVTTMFLLDTVLTIFDIHDVILEVTTVLTSSSPASLQDKYEHAQLASLWPLAPIFYTLMTVLGDTVIIWRVFVFWYGTYERWFLSVLVAIFLASVVLLFMIINCSVRAKGLLVLGNLENGVFCMNVQSASYLATVITTLVATLMIGYKTWVYRRQIGSVLSGSSSRSRVERVMMILVESGVMYFLFYTAVFIPSIGNLATKESKSPSLTFSSTIFNYASSRIVGIYPTIIVILVHYQKSYIDSATQQATSIQFGTLSVPNTTRTFGNSDVSSSTQAAMRSVHRTMVTLPEHELTSIPNQSASVGDGDSEVPKVAFAEEREVQSVQDMV
ncbi:hypothetical protein K488DRAFT_57743 [Vararia minispora EC-137]|uniref:Uncharacterized protein n=1 Tax=Vararia minispora EC-137 TaxID=1314806 RepID=A0ACB8QAC9_9AGAM|nr:hypothetical protein K488DRAFT_57743 [Vararia minispora EC-137]